MYFRSLVIIADSAIGTNNKLQAKNHKPVEKECKTKIHSVKVTTIDEIGKKFSIFKFIESSKLSKESVLSNVIVSSKSNGDQSIDSCDD